MAVATQCQTHGCVYTTFLAKDAVSVWVELPFDLNLTESEAATLKANIHNVMELVLAPYFTKKDQWLN